METTDNELLKLIVFNLRFIIFIMGAMLAILIGMSFRYK